LSPAKYVKLLSAALPKVIETLAALNRAVRLMEALDCERRDKKEPLSAG